MVAQRTVGVENTRAALGTVLVEVVTLGQEARQARRAPVALQLAAPPVPRADARPPLASGPQKVRPAQTAPAEALALAVRLVTAPSAQTPEDARAARRAGALEVA